MSQEDDHMILISNTKSFADFNTRSHFRTQLARRRNFPSSEDWRVAITDITYNQTWYNLKNSVSLEFVYLSGPIMKEPATLEVQQMLTIEAGFYQSIGQLILVINSKMQAIEPVVDTVPELIYNIYTHQVKIKPGKSLLQLPKNASEYELMFIPVLGDEIENLLGLVDGEGLTTCDRINEVIDEGMTEFQHYLKTHPYDTIDGMFPANIDRGFTNLFVYSDIVKASDVGDSHVRLLLCVPNKHSKQGWGGHVHHEPKNLIYRPVDLQSFDTIEIDIRDDSGHPVNFLAGEVVIKLHFVRHG